MVRVYDLRMGNDEDILTDLKVALRILHLKDRRTIHWRMGVYKTAPLGELCGLIPLLSDCFFERGYLPFLCTRWGV